MPSCIVNGCNSSWKLKEPDLVLHSFPRDINIIRRWLLETPQDFGNVDATCQKIFLSAKGAFRMCSKHFSLDCYEVRGTTRCLKKDALPTIFPSETCIPKTPKSKNVKKDDRPMCIFAGIENFDHLYARSPTLLGSSTISVPIISDSDVIDVDSEHCLEEAAVTVIEVPIHTHTSSREHRNRGILRKGSRTSHTRSIGTMTDYFPGQVHKSTQTDLVIGTKNKKVMANISKSNRSLGIQCHVLEEAIRGTLISSRTSEDNHNYESSNVYSSNTPQVWIAPIPSKSRRVICKQLEKQHPIFYMV
ncbi:hypothetical protein GDO81_017954 [Engystomops pustulosus]|uniref:THAP-type domain-containing protein n=1 Tax=Engystomops pustulosus TaxID=76066 RepID=A0AAV7A8L6_ENGPU|nr:hypothetical protein GDO81_017954 [Engystomops pustulosus]